MNVNEAAQYLGVTPGRIRQLLSQKVFTGRKVTARAWLIPRGQIERYKMRRDAGEFKGGWPKGKPRKEQPNGI